MSGAAPDLEAALRDVLTASPEDREQRLLALCEVAFGPVGETSPLMRLVLARVDDLVTTAVSVGRTDEREAVIAHLRKETAAARWDDPAGASALAVATRGLVAGDHQRGP